MNTNTSLTESVVYSLRWDENGLRDKTLSEIRKDALKEITCPCRNRKYCVKNESIIRHFETNAHKEWVEIQKKEHVKEFGNCCSPEQRIEFLLKENREYKKLVAKMANQSKIYEDTIAEFKRIFKEFSLKTSVEEIL